VQHSIIIKILSTIGSTPVAAATVYDCVTMDTRVWSLQDYWWYMLLVMIAADDPIAAATHCSCSWCMLQLKLVA